MNPTQIIEQWFTEHFHNSKASQDVEVYNLLHAAKEDLIQRLGDSPHEEITIEEPAP